MACGDSPQSRGCSSSSRIQKLGAGKDPEDRACHTRRGPHSAHPTGLSSDSPRRLTGGAQVRTEPTTSREEGVSGELVSLHEDTPRDPGAPHEVALAGMAQATRGPMSAHHSSEARQGHPPATTGTHAASQTPPQPAWRRGTAGCSPLLPGHLQNLAEYP